MNRTHSSRKQDIEMFIKIEILNGNLTKASMLADRYKITPNRFKELVRQVESVGK